GDAANEDRPKIRVTGTIKGVSVRRQNDKVVGNNIALDLVIENMGNDALIFFADQIDVSDGISRTLNGKLVGRFTNVGSSFIKSRSEMLTTWSADPSNSNRLTKLLPGEKLKVESWLMLDSDQLVSDPTQTIGRLRTMGKLCLTVRTTFVDPVYQFNGHIQSSRTLWALLRSQVLGQGYLWLDEATSEPIPFDMNETKVTTEP
ncbi:MAG: hypothetical protein ABIZ95_10395, partial [Pyrinomonadaceae bacterium]